MSAAQRDGKAMGGERRTKGSFDGCNAIGGREGGVSGLTEGAAPGIWVPSHAWDWVREG